MNPDLDRLDQYIELLEKDLDEQRKLGIDFAEKQSDYKVKHGRKMLECKVRDDLKTVADREAYVESELSTELLDMKIAEAVLDAQKERTRSIRAIISALQSLNASSRL